MTAPFRFASGRPDPDGSHYWQAGGGVSYSLGEVDIFASFVKYVWGRDAHNGRVYTTGVSWYFDLNQ